MLMNNLFIKEFIYQSVFRMSESTDRIIKCLSEFTDAELWMRPNEYSNSIGNIILHLCGNIRQYVISSLSKTEDIRERDVEFSSTGGFNKTELCAKLSQTVKEAVGIIENLAERDLIKTYSVQGFNLSGIGIIIHVTEHYSYHTGQVAFWTKILKNKDLGFYAKIDLNAKNRH
jgi:uncharacterized damage-inducible protein DinB